MVPKDPVVTEGQPSTAEDSGQIVARDEGSPREIGGAEATGQAVEVISRGEIKKKNQDAHVPGHDTRIEQAETRTDQAETRSEQAIRASEVNSLTAGTTPMAAGIPVQQNQSQTVSFQLNGGSGSQSLSGRAPNDAAASAGFQLPHAHVRTL